MGPPPLPPPPPVPPPVPPGDPPQVYRLPPDGFRTVRRRVWVKTAAFGILALAVAVGLNRTIFATPQALLLVPLVLAMLAFAAVRSIRRARELWLSIEWVITDHDLTRRSPHVPMVVIRRNEVAPLGVLVAAGLVWTVWATGRSKHVDERTRRHSLWLLLLLVVIALRITLVLSNGRMWAWTGAGQ